MKNSPRPPKTLSRKARYWWKKLQDDFGIEDSGGVLLLNLAMENFDWLRQSEEAIRREGLTIVDRFGQRKQNPNVLTARDARNGMLKALRQLNLDVEPLRDGPGRPSGR